MDIRTLLSSKAYSEARGNIDRWNARLDSGSREDAEAVRAEKLAYFSRMREKEPQLYAVFQLDDKTLGERIYLITTGKRAVMD